MRRRPVRWTCIQSAAGRLPVETQPQGFVSIEATSTCNSIANMAQLRDSKQPLSSTVTFLSQRDYSLKNNIFILLRLMVQHCLTNISLTACFASLCPLHETLIPHAQRRCDSLSSWVLFFARLLLFIWFPYRRNHPNSVVPLFLNIAAQVFLISINHQRKWRFTTTRCAPMEVLLRHFAFFCPSIYLCLPRTSTLPRWKEKNTTPVLLTRPAWIHHEFSHHHPVNDCKHSFFTHWLTGWWRQNI